jgi:hypothetical protein
MGRRGNGDGMEWISEKEKFVRVKWMMCDFDVTSASSLSTLLLLIATSTEVFSLT